MKETNDILDKIGRRSGMTVPEGFFDNFVAKMSDELPEIMPEETDLAPLTMWQRFRPYVYMAAMFAGIWCMMKMFGMLSGPATDFTDINNYPGVVTALSDKAFVDDYIYHDIDESQLLEEIYQQSTDSIGEVSFNVLTDEIFNDSI